MRTLNHLAILVLAIIMFGASSAAGDVSPSELWKAGRIDEAIRALNNAVSADQKNASAYFMLSRAYYSLEDFDSAANFGEKAVQLRPNDAEYQYWLGRAYGEKADRAGALSAMSFAKKARSCFERALQIDPEFDPARRALAEFYIEAPGIMGGGRDKARNLADQVSSSDPALAAWIRAVVANKEKNWSEAEAQFKNAVKASGNASWAWLELARFFGWSKRWPEYEAAINSALTSDKKRPADLVNAAEMLLGTGRNFTAAERALQSYLAGQKRDDEFPAFRVHYLLGQIHEKLGHKAQAAQEYRTALSHAQGFRPAQDALKRVTA